MNQSNKNHILVIEDEEHLAVGIKYNLEAEGFRVTAVGDGNSAIKIVNDHPDDVNLIILDLMLPGMSGYAVCETLRDAGHMMPILILSARTLTQDRTSGFNVGANQYMTKPFELDELISRVNNLLTLYVPKDGAASSPNGKLITYEFGKALINFDTHEVTVDGRPVHMTALQLKLLNYFVSNEGRVIPRHELLEKVWEMPGHMNTRAPDQFLRQLRKIFEPEPSKPVHFLTIRDAGYRFVAEPELGGEQRSR